MLSDFPTIPSHDLETVSGGFDLKSLMNLNFGQIGQTIGGLVDSFKGGGNAGQIGGQIGGLIQQFMGMFGGGGGGAGAQQQQQGAPQQQQQGAPQGGE